MARFIVLFVSLFCFCTATFADELDQLEKIAARALSGDAIAQNLLILYSSSDIGTKKYPEKTAYWMLKMAENGNRVAQYELGNKYYLYNYNNNQGIEKDSDKAVQWYEKSAQQNYAPGQHMAGHMYTLKHVEGKNLQPNIEKAIYWYQLAAQQEDAQAIFYLGCFKYFGIGTAKNQEEGEALILKASNKGFSQAKSFCQNKTKEKVDTELLQRTCNIHPGSYMAALIKTAQQPEIVTEKNGNITNFKVVGSLASKQDIGCIKIEKAKNSFTPADLYKGVSTCLAQEKFEEASALFLLAGLYSRYDAVRVTDKTAGQAGSALIVNTFANIKPDIKAKFGAAVEKDTKDPASIQRICEQIVAIGPPDYYPEYMILHGMKAFTGNPHEGAIASDFNKTATWAELQTKQLHCK